MGFLRARGPGSEVEDSQVHGEAWVERLVKGGRRERPLVLRFAADGEALAQSVWK